MANPQTRGNEFVATIWQAEDKGKYGEANFTTFSKKKDGTYENSQFSFVRFVGNGIEGFQNIIRQLENSQKGVKINIKNMEISRKQYVDDAGKKVFPKNYQFVVWDWDFMEDGDTPVSKKTKKMDTPPVVEPEEEDPFSEPEEEDPFGD